MGVGDGQGSLVCRGPWNCRVRQDERLNGMEMMYHVLSKTFEELKEFKIPKFPFNYIIIEKIKPLAFFEALFLKTAI